jgi:G3E family GTPase
MSQIPVTVLTGYLGAGKTTLLNRILTEDHGRKYAVIINEFGESNIDNDLVVGADEEIFEMNNGCICCTVRGDLVRIIAGLMKRADKLDGIIVETTGLANPAPVAQTFFMDDEVRAKTALDAIVTVVDARFFLERLADSREAEDQVAFADVVLVNKTDLVGADELKAVEAKVRAINPYAKQHRTQNSKIALDAILDKGAFDLQRILAIECDHDPGHDHGHDHHGHDHHDHAAPHASHDVTVSSISLGIDGEIDPEKFQQWIGQVLAQSGADILRSKGILSVKDARQRFVFQAVHMIADSTWGLEWKAGDKRASKLVFIGRNLDREKLAAGFESCRA